MQFLIDQWYDKTGHSGTVQVTIYNNLPDNGPIYILHSLSRQSLPYFDKTHQTILAQFHPMTVPPPPTFPRLDLHSPHSQGLVKAVEQLMVEPVPRETPYALEAKGEVYFSQFGQDREIERILRGKVRLSVFSSTHKMLCIGNILSVTAPKLSDLQNRFGQNTTY